MAFAQLHPSITDRIRSMAVEAERITLHGDSAYVDCYELELRPGEAERLLRILRSLLDLRWITRVVLQSCFFAHREAFMARACAELGAGKCVMDYTEFLEVPDLVSTSDDDDAMAAAMEGLAL